MEPREQAEPQEFSADAGFEDVVVPVRTPRAAPRPARRMRFTDESISELEGEGRQYYVWDTRHTGLGVRVGVAGRIAFVMKISLPGSHSIWKTLEAEDLTGALVEYHELLGKFGRGEALPKRPADARWQDVVDRFEAAHLPHVKPSTRETYKCALKLLREGFLNRPVRAITFEDIQGFHESMADRPRQANICVMLMKLVLDRCEAWRLRDLNTNPVTMLKKSGWKPYREEQRDVRLTDEQLWKIGEALSKMEAEGEESPYPIAAVRLLLFTGLRLRNVLGLQWAQVDLEGRNLVLENHKTAGQVGTLRMPLNDPTLQVLRGLPRLHGNPYVLPGGKPGAPIDDIRKFWNRMLHLAGLEHVEKSNGEVTVLRRHDLRHAHGNMAADLDMSLQTTAALLGHRNTATSARYSKRGVNKALESSQKVAKTLKAKMGKKA